LHPGPPGAAPGWSENDYSCVLLVSSPRARILLPGDIELRAESFLTRNGLIPEVDLLIAPHHGSASSSSGPFVAATRPGVVVFSAGHRNRWGFPDRDVATRWREIGARLITTGDSGALVFETDGNGVLELRTRHRADARRIWTE
jgi:competence protein ComEC